MLHIPRIDVEKLYLFVFYLEYTEITFTLCVCPALWCAPLSGWSLRAGLQKPVMND